MMSDGVIRFIGDIHGKMEEYMEIVNQSPYPTIQVGDYGIGFRANPITSPLHTRHMFIRGNHDNPYLCRVQSNWIPDGTIVNNIAFIGGASSIDRMWRTEGVDWWPEEQLTIGELNRILDVIAETKPDIIVSHECPEFVSDDIVKHFNMRKFQDDNRTRMMLQSIYDIYTPKYHIFGHWHVSYHKKINGTKFICLNELETFDLFL